MKKNLILTALAVSVFVLGYGISYAQEPSKEDMPKPVPIENNSILPLQDNGVDIKQGPNNYFHGEFKRPNDNYPQIKGMKPSKAEMEAKKAEFERRLNLTEKQKKKIEENKKKDHEKVKPLFDQMREKKHELRKIKRDNTISPKDKEKKIGKLKSDIKILNDKADKYRQENMKKFESVLTEEQKQEFSKIKEEQKQEMERRRAEFEGRQNPEMKPIPPEKPINLPSQE